MCLYVCRVDDIIKSNMKHPKAANKSETGPIDKTRKESLKKSDNKCEVSETPQCETAVV